jgi:hypothetical protein
MEPSKENEEALAEISEIWADFGRDLKLSNEQDRKQSSPEPFYNTLPVAVQEPTDSDENYQNISFIKGLAEEKEKNEQKAKSAGGNQKELLYLCAVGSLTTENINLKHETFQPHKYEARLIGLSSDQKTEELKKIERHWQQETHLKNDTTILEKIKTLISRGADLTACNEEGKSLQTRPQLSSCIGQRPLHLLTMRDFSDSLRWCIENGANLEVLLANYDND